MKWISVKERLPEPDELVITFPYSPVTIRHMKVEDGEPRWFFDAIPVTHWQPLPEPPVGKNKQPSIDMANDLGITHEQFE